MKLSNKQKMMLHVAAKAAGFTDDQRKLIQWNVGGFHSCADTTITREGVNAVMAFYEVTAGGQLPRFTPGYWVECDKKSNPGDTLRYRIRKEAESLGWTDAQLDAFIAGKHMSSGAAPSLADADPYWLRRALDGLIQMNTRARRCGASPTAATPSGSAKAACAGATSRSAGRDTTYPTEGVDHGTAQSRE